MKPSKFLSGALAALLAGSPVGVAFAAPADKPKDAPAPLVTKNPFLKAGIRLYNELEFAAALDQFKRAESYTGNSTKDDVVIHIYEGIVQYESNNKDQAETEFRIALAINADAELPKNVSPKISNLFEKVRLDVKKDVSVVGAVTVPGSDVPAADPTVTTTPAGGLQGGVVKKEEPAGAPVAPWVALGIGVVAGVGGAVVAVRAHSLGTTAQNDTFQDQASTDLSTSKGLATGAYCAIGVSAVALATFVTLYLIEGSGSGSGSGSAAK